MKFFPELEEVKKIAADGKYRVLPVSRKWRSPAGTGK